ncbi:methyltransferase domain-containing protein [Streptomyces sp. NPDC028722]|uniref:class I SAM-dependent DNA methyltransferase n=1 Tax=Streptomyces sp. NPDC028722 TaxID=3155016 RepID=UPI0033E81856
MTLLRDADLAAAFDHAARSYDTLVAANPGYHAHLRRSVRRLGLPGHGAGLRLLDLGCGTGASTAALRSVLPAAHITAVDASAGMLDRAAAKPWANEVTFVRAPVEGLAEAGVSGPFDAVFAAYLFRNVSDPDAVLTTARDLLAPGGRFGVHEYTLSGRRADRAVWTLVCRGLVQPTASALGDGELYRHLWRSVVEFDTADRFAGRVRAAGFEHVRALPLPGWQTGITHTIVARRPETAHGPGTSHRSETARRPEAAHGPEAPRRPETSPGPQTSHRPETSR